MASCKFEQFNTCGSGAACDSTDYNNLKQMKYMTYNHHPYGLDKTLNTTEEPGFVAWNGYGVGACVVNYENALKLSAGNINTSLRTRKNIQSREFTGNPGMGKGCGNIPIESELIQGLFQEKSRPCLQSFWGPERTFEIFDHLNFNPQHGESGGVSQCYTPGSGHTKSYPQAPRGGVDSRADLQNAFQASKN